MENEKICRHKELVDVDSSHKECVDCKVWKGVREEAHYYNMEYYMNPVWI